jgi:hypothetical protein
LPASCIGITLKTASFSFELSSSWETAESIRKGGSTMQGPAVCPIYHAICPHYQAPGHIENRDTQG